MIAVVLAPGLTLVGDITYTALRLLAKLARTVSVLYRYLWVDKDTRGLDRVLHSYRLVFFLSVLVYILAQVAELRVEVPNYILG